MGTVRCCRLIMSAMFRSTFVALALVSIFALEGVFGAPNPNPWYQGNGLADCAPGKCPPTAEISPVKCSGDPTNCAEGEECDEAAAAEGAGNPCRVPARK